MALFRKIKSIFKKAINIFDGIIINAAGFTHTSKEKKKLKYDTKGIDKKLENLIDEMLSDADAKQKKKNLITKFDLGDKRKLTEIKKTFKIDKFNKILNSDKGISIFKAIETITKMELDILDEFHTKMGLAKFFKKISNQLEYEPIIRFDYNDYESYSENSEYGLLKCILNKKGDFQDYLIFYSAWVGDHMNLGTLDGTMSPVYLFKLNEKIDSKKLLKVMDTQLKRNSKSKFTASKVYLFKKLDWSKEKLKKYINKKDFLVFIEKY